MVEDLQRQMGNRDAKSRCQQSRKPSSGGQRDGRLNWASWQKLEPQGGPQVLAVGVLLEMLPALPGQEGGKNPLAFNLPPTRGQRSKEKNFTYK